MDEVSCLSDSQLALKLKNHGLPNGPITKGTRRLFETVLRKHLFSAEQSPLVDESLEERPANDRHKEIKETQVDTKTNAEAPNIDHADHGSTHCGTYYGIHHLPKDDESDMDTSKENLVFTTLNEALIKMKTLKSARLKSFSSRDEAQRFSQDGGFESTEIKTQPADQEPSIPFRSPTPQQLVIFRRYIEKGNLQSAHDCIFQNPRYLVSSGETPVILQEGSRYNAMHVAAKANEVQMCHLIVSTLNDEKFWDLMFPNQEDTALSLRRAERMLDYYVNSPDKGAGDTPLHIACKFGFTEVVRFLVLLPYLETDKQNLFGETPVQVIGSRCSQRDERHKIILDLLSPKMYVPLLRTEDDISSPILSPPVTTLSNSCIRSLDTVTSSSKLDSKAEVRAYAGPMSPDKAHAFIQEWKSPKKKFRNDFEKGKEREGRKLAKSHGVPWMEYWSFLGSFADFTSMSGLKKLEKYFESKLETQKSMDIDIYATPARKGNASSFHVQPRETDDFDELDLDKKLIAVEGSARETTAVGKENSISLVSENECVKKSLIKEFDDDLFTDERTNDMKIQPEEKCLLPLPNHSNEIELNFTSRTHEENALETSTSVGLLQAQSEELGQNFNSRTNEEKTLTKHSSVGLLQAQSHEIGRKLPLGAHKENPLATNTSVTLLQAQGRAIDEISGEQNCESRLGDAQMNDIAAQLGSITLNEEKIERRTCDGGDETKICDRSKNIVRTSVRETLEDRPAWHDLPPKASCLSDMTSPVFINGSFPCKSDFDVFRALDGVSINPSDFPLVHTWMRRVSSYSKDERNRWPSPCSPRFRSYVAKKAPTWTF